MQPSTRLLFLLTILSLFYGYVMLALPGKRAAQEESFQTLRQVVARLGVSDLSLSTEARYTRHPAVSDPVVVIMDHPGAIDHFPSTLFWAPAR